MSGLCGWIEPPGPDGGGGEALSNMASGLLALEESEATAAAAGECALHLLARRGDGYVSADDDFLVAIAGRPYWTSPDSAATARELGHAEALRQAYLERGVDLFDRLHGGFALALIDRRERTAILAIDRVGVETMCFAQGAGGLFVFGSTTASVRRHPRISATIPMQAIYNYLCSWIIHAPATIYREQTKLRPGQYALYRGGRVETRFYWQMPYQESSEEDPAGLSRELLSVLRTATTRTIEGSDPSRLGAFLSGGLDSSTTVGLLTRINGAAKAFTIGFGIEKFDESPYARIAARHFGAEHYQHVVTPGDVADLIPRLAHYFDEPFGNSSVVPTYYCARLAREHGVDLLIAGDGGDEIFAGNERYVQMTRAERYGRIPRPLRSWAIEPLLSMLPGGDSASLVGRARRHIDHYKTPMPKRIYAYETGANTPVEEMFEPDVTTQFDPEYFDKLALEAYSRPESGAMLQRMMHLDLQVTLADGDLRKVRRMCLAAGVQVRFPLLDDEVVAFSARVPPDVMIQDGRLRSFFKNAMRGFLPDEIIAKPKHGFGLPFQQWLKTDSRLKELVEDSLSAFAKRNYVRPQFLDRVRTSHRNAKVTGLDGLAYDIMVLELWLQEHAIGAKSASHGTNRPISAAVGGIS